MSQRLPTTRTAGRRGRRLITRLRSFVGAGLVFAASLIWPSATAAAPAVNPTPMTRSTRYSSPLHGGLLVLRRFDTGLGPYAAGHRGVDLAVGAGDQISAAADGQVTFAGAVGGRGVVTIRHPDGVVTEYEPVDPTVRRGSPISRDQPIGRAVGGHAGCRPSVCLHWGARRADGYLDPLTLLMPLGPVRLIPTRSASRV